MSKEEDPLIEWIQELGHGSALKPTEPSITCPICFRTSYNPNDIREGYCGYCHKWTSPPREE
jgi:hypothetical protein